MVWPALITPPHYPLPPLEGSGSGGGVQSFYLWISYSDPGVRLPPDSGESREWGDEHGFRKNVYGVTTFVTDPPANVLIFSARNYKINMQLKDTLAGAVLRHRCY